MKHLCEHVVLCFTAGYNQTISEGSEMTVSCENEGEVTWSKLADRKREIILKAYQGQDPDQTKADPDRRYGVLSNLSLVIKEAWVSDSGIYYCNASDVMNLTVTPLRGGFKMISSFILMFLLNNA